MMIIAAVSARPISAQPKIGTTRSGSSAPVMNQNAIADSTPETITPLYSAFMILPPAPTRTKKVPMIEEMIEAAPSASG